MTAIKDMRRVPAGPTNKSRSAITPGPELSVIVPTRNEHDNICPVYDALCRTLQGIDWEAIFVDDDPFADLPVKTAGCAAFSGLAAAGLLPPASKESWRAPRLTSR